MSDDNTLSEKYKRISSRYYMRVDARYCGRVKYLLIKAKSIVISGFKDFDFFIHEEWDGFRISEGLTGLGLVQFAPSKEYAIDRAVNRLKKHGEKLEGYIEKNIKRCGLSPRYKLHIKEPTT